MIERSTHEPRRVVTHRKKVGRHALINVAIRVRQNDFVDIGRFGAFEASAISVYVLVPCHEWNKDDIIRT